MYCCESIRKRITFNGVCAVAITIFDIIAMVVVVQWVVAGAFSPFALLLLLPFMAVAFKLWKEPLAGLPWVRKCRGLLHQAFQV